MGLVASRWIRPERRTVIGLAAVALAFGYWTLVRMDGVWGGDFKAERSWRWSRTAEDDYLAARRGPHRWREPRRAAGRRRMAWLSRARARWRGAGCDARRGLAGATSPRALAHPGGSGMVVVRGRGPADLHPGATGRARGRGRLRRRERRGALGLRVSRPASSRRWAEPARGRRRPWPAACSSRSAPRDSCIGSSRRPERWSGRPTCARTPSGEPPTWGFASSPLVVDDMVIVHAGGEGDRGCSPMASTTVGCAGAPPPAGTPTARHSSRALPARARSRW